MSILVGTHNPKKKKMKELNIMNVTSWSLKYKSPWEIVRVFNNSWGLSRIYPIYIVINDVIVNVYYKSFMCK